MSAVSKVWLMSTVLLLITTGHLVDGQPCFPPAAGDATGIVNGSAYIGTIAETTRFVLTPFNDVCSSEDDEPVLCQCTIDGSIGFKAVVPSCVTLTCDDDDCQSQPGRGPCVTVIVFSSVSMDASECKTPGSKPPINIEMRPGTDTSGDVRGVTLTCGRQDLEEDISTEQTDPSEAVSTEAPDTGEDDTDSNTRMLVLGVSLGLCLILTLVIGVVIGFFCRKCHKKKEKHNSGLEAPAVDASFKERGPRDSTYETIPDNEIKSNQSEIEVTTSQPTYLYIHLNDVTGNIPVNNNAPSKPPVERMTSEVVVTDNENYVSMEEELKHMSSGSQNATTTAKSSRPSSDLEIVDNKDYISVEEEESTRNKVTLDRQTSEVELVDNKGYTTYM